MEKCRGPGKIKIWKTPLFAADLRDERAWTDTAIHKNDDNEKLSLVGLGSRRTQSSTDLFHIDVGFIMEINYPWDPCDCHTNDLSGDGH